MIREEKFWEQKSRVTWLQKRDRNTKFFHVFTLVRRTTNKIEGLFNDNKV